MEVSGQGPGGRWTHESTGETSNSCAQAHARAEPGPQPDRSVGLPGCVEPPDSLFLLPTDRVLEHLSSLSREVNLEYERSMNKINFDQIVSSKPKTFSYVTLPKKEEEKVPKQGEGVGQRRPYGHPPSQSPSCPICKSDTCTYLSCLQHSSPPSANCLETWGWGWGW